MKTSTLIAVILWNISMAWAQNPQVQIDSLRQVLQTATDASLVVDVQNRMARQFLRISADSAKRYAAFAENGGKAMGNALAQAEALKTLGTVASNDGDYVDAQNKYQQALDFFIAEKSELGQAQCYNNMAIVQMRLGKYEDALEYINLAITMKGQLKDSASLANSIDTKGAIYEAKKDYPNAILNYESSFKIHDKYSPPLRKAEVYDNMGRVYGILGNELALGCILKAIYIRRENGDKRGLGSSYRSIAKIYAEKNNLDKAFEYAKQALTLCDETHETLIKAEVLAFLGGLYIQKGDFGQAAIHEGRALQIAEPLNATNILVAIYKNMGEIYAAQQDYPKSIEAFEKSIALIDKANFDAQGAAAERKSIATRLVNIGTESHNRDIVRRYEPLSGLKDK